MNLNNIKNIKLLSFILVFLTIITISPMAFAVDGLLQVQFYDENSLAILDGNVSIVDVTNNVTYNPDANGYWDTNLTFLNWKNKYINAYVERKVDGITTHTRRNFQFYWNADQNYDLSFALLPVGLGADIEFLVKDTNNDLWNNKYVQFKKNALINNNYIDVNHNISMSNSGNTTNHGGVRIYINSTKVNLDSVYKGSSTPTKAYLKQDNGTLIATATFIGNKATFNPAPILNNNTYYRIELGSDGSNFYRYWSSSTSNFPINSTYLNYITGSENGVNINQMQIITGIKIKIPINGIVTLSSSKTSSIGVFSDYLFTSGDYNAVLYDATGTEGDTYQKTTVNVKKPKNEKSLADISPYDVEVGGLLIYSLSNQSAAQTSINIFGGTTSTYDFTVVDYNADPVDRTYIPKTYNVKNPFGLGYSPTYNLQSYLITKEDGVIPSIVVYDELKTPYPGITVSIFKQIEGTTQLVEQKRTDSTGRTSFVGFPLDTYFVYLYENGTLKGSYEIQVRDSDETFYFVISREVDQDVVYRGLDLKYSWNNTPEYVDISSTDIDLNLSVYADYLNDFNITSYEIKAYQNNTLKETLTGDLAGTSVTITDSLNRLNYTSGMPVKIVADITFDYAGQTRILNLLKTINVDSKTTGLLTVLKNFPSKVGVLWTIILSILITISILVLFGTSDFVSKDYLMYVGLFILGFFVFIGWFATGVEVFGIDSMWFIYIVTVIASVGFALQDSQR